MLETVVLDHVAGRLHTLASQAGPTLALTLPAGRRLGPADASVHLRLHSLTPLPHLLAGRIGRLAQDYVEGKLDIEGRMRDVVAVAGALVRTDPTDMAEPLLPLPRWWREWLQRGRSMARHRSDVDTRQVQQHYDLSDEFYAMWLDPQRIYSCAYYRSPAMALAQAQQAKLEHICCKLRLQRGERFLDIGAGWGALMLWAAQHHGVEATGITLSRNQHAHVDRRIDELGLRGRVQILLMDYRSLPEADPYDKIASVGMFEHVGRANLPKYFAKIRRLLRPGGLLLNHGITAGGTQNAQLGAGIGDFIERYIFPGGELLHISHVLRTLSEAGLEGLDTENLRPHYARTLWDWSDALEARLAAGQALVGERTVRAYRLYLAGSAMAFERGWMALHQTLAALPDGDVARGPLRGAQSDYPFNRDYMTR